MLKRPSENGRTETSCIPAVARIFAAPVSYDAASALQERLVQERLTDAIPDTVLLLEHQPVISLGTAADRGHLLLSPAQLARRGVALVRSARGGDVTWHGPGQLVVYPILKLRPDERDVHGYLHRLEETAILTAAAFGITARRRSGLTGAWTDAGKLAAIGIRIRRWITFHGLSFNVAPDLDGFKYIVPCGLVGESVTSLHALLPAANRPEMSAVRVAWQQAFETVFQRRIEAVIQVPLIG